MKEHRSGNSAHVFDRVIVGHNQRRLSREQFLTMPLPERIALILGGKVTFFRGDTPVPQELALKSLMAAAKSA